MLLGLIGLLVVAFATTRMAYLERRMRRARFAEPSSRVPVRSTV
jgi:hypothetical protein